MFLNRLSKEEQLAFLKLAHFVARTDGTFDESEQEMIRGYCVEMQIENINFNIDQFDIYNTLEIIKDKRSQNIVLLEIMAIIFADNFLHEKEQKVIEIMLEKFGLNQHLATVYGEWTKAILALYAQGNALIEI